MITNLINMNGYGLFVWLSFGSVSVLCTYVYLKTKKTMKKYEKEFLVELQNLSEIEKKTILKQSKIANQILATGSKVS
mgnify:CR=1 FL=1|jgi:heme exporter protein D